MDIWEVSDDDDDDVMLMLRLVGLRAGVKKQLIFLWTCRATVNLNVAACGTYRLR